MKLVSDNGSLPPSTGFTAAMRLLEIDQVFTSHDNPKGNAETERLMRTIKEELLRLREFTYLEEARVAFRQWNEVDYKLYCVHSSLGYKSPVEFTSMFRQQESLPRWRNTTHSQRHKTCLDVRGTLQHRSACLEHLSNGPGVSVV